MCRPFTILNLVGMSAPTGDGAFRRYCVSAQLLVFVNLFWINMKFYLWDTVHFFKVIKLVLVGIC